MRATTWQHAYSHLFTEEQLASIPVEESAARLRRQLEAAPERYHTLVAELGDVIVGFAGLGPKDFSADETRVGELYAIYVLPGCTDGGTKDEEWLGTTAPAVRYRIALDTPAE